MGAKETNVLSTSFLSLFFVNVCKWRVKGLLQRHPEAQNLSCMAAREPLARTAVLGETDFGQCSSNVSIADKADVRDHSRSIPWDSVTVPPRPERRLCDRAFGQSCRVFRRNLLLASTSQMSTLRTRQM